MYCLYFFKPQYAKHTPYNIVGAMKMLVHLQGVWGITASDFGEIARGDYHTPVHEDELNLHRGGVLPNLLLGIYLEKHYVSCGSRVQCLILL